MANVVSKSLAAAAALGCIVLALTLGSAHAGTNAPPVPPEIQVIIDKLRKHEPVSADEQRALQAWTMRKANGTGQDPSNTPTSDQNVAMPKDVQEIMARMQSGKRPTGAELARLKAWAAEVRQNKGHLIEDVNHTRDELETIEGAPPRPRPGRVDLSVGTVTVTLDQALTGPSGGAHTTGSIAFPVRYTWVDKGAAQPTHLRFVPDPSRRYEARVAGTATSHDDGGDPAGCGPHDDVITSQVEAAGTPGDGRVTVMGELVSVPNRPRPYLDATVVVAAQGAVHGTCQCKGDNTSNGPPMLVPVTLDALRGDVPFNNGLGDAPMSPVGSRLMDQAGDLAKSFIESATFDVDVEAIRAGLRGSAPFRVTGQYEHHLAQDGGSVDARAVVAFDFGPGCEPDLVVAPAGYETWVPKGSLADPSAPGNELEVEATLQCRDGRALPEELMASAITFTLSEVSREPGTAMNYPLGGTSVGLDLTIDPMRNQALHALDSAGLSAETKTAVTSAKAVISSFDFGGYGELSVKATLLDGRVVVGHLAGHDEPRVLLPKRAPDSHIADAWRDAHAPGRNDPDDDDAEPAGQGCVGDGLTVYEEYRGFATGSGADIVRTNPAEKDVFVRNEVGDNAVAGIGYFRAATKLVVHDDLTATQLTADRVINGNAGSAPGHIDQHAIRLIAAGPGGGNEAAAIGVPSDVSSVAIAVPGPGARGKLEHDASVAHEMLHDSNVFHHGDGDRTPVRWARAVDGTVYENSRDAKDKVSSVHITLKNEHGAVILATDPLVAPLFPDSAYFDKVYIAAWNGEHSGNEDCLMRYAFNIDVGGGAYRVVVADKSDPTVRYVLDRPEAIGTTLCTSDVGTGVNAAGRSPLQWHGDAQRGNCASQVCINDRYSTGGVK